MRLRAKCKGSPGNGGVQNTVSKIDFANEVRTEIIQTRTSLKNDSDFSASVFCCVFVVRVFSLNVFETLNKTKIKQVFFLFFYFKIIVVKIHILFKIEHRKFRL